MGVVADAALAAGGQVIGVLPDILMTRERAPAALSELHVVGSMHERKAMMADLSDGFIALPGGMGTFEEFCEIITWGQLGLHSKPCGLLNVEGYYDPLLALVDRAITDGFIRPNQRSMVNASDSIENLLDQFDTYVAPTPSLQINLHSTPDIGQVEKTTFAHITICSNTTSQIDGPTFSKAIPNLSHAAASFKSDIPTSKGINTQLAKGLKLLAPDCDEFANGGLG